MVRKNILSKKKNCLTYTDVVRSTVVEFDLILL